MSEYVGGYTHQKYPTDEAIKADRFETFRGFPSLLGVCGCQGKAVRHQSTCLRIKIAEVILKILLKQFQLGTQAKFSHYVMYVIGQLAFKSLQKGREPTKKPEFT